MYEMMHDLSLLQYRKTWIALFLNLKYRYEFVGYPV